MYNSKTWLDRRCLSKYAQCHRRVCKAHVSMGELARVSTSTYVHNSTKVCITYKNLWLDTIGLVHSNSAMG